MSGRSKIKVAAMGDLHVQEPAHHLNLQEVFAEVCERADVLALCGDLTNFGLPEEATGLANILRTCSIPVVAVLGNHDYHSGHADEVKKILHDAKVSILDGGSFEVGDVGFAGAKGFGGGFGEHMLASFGEEAIKNFVTEAVSEALKLETALRSLNTKHKVVLLHYAPVFQTVQGEPPEIMPFLGSSRLAETIDRFEVTAVFHGHAHRGTFQAKTSKGAMVYNCCFDLVMEKQKHPYVLVEI